MAQSIPSLFARTVRRRMLAACLAALCAALSLWAWHTVLGARQARLTRLGLPGLAQGPCSMSGAAIQTGLALDVASEWVIRADVVPVMRAFVEDGWESTTYMTSTMELAAKSPAVIHLGLVQFRIYRGASLSYTEARDTRVVSSTSIIVCPP